MFDHPRVTRESVRLFELLRMYYHAIRFAILLFARKLFVWNIVYITIHFIKFSIIENKFINFIDIIYDKHVS